MPAIDDDDRPKKKITHEIGQELALLSVGELTERIALLKEEIARLEEAAAKKRATLVVQFSHPRLAVEAGKLYIRPREIKVGQLAREPPKPASNAGSLF